MPGAAVGPDDWPKTLVRAPATEEQPAVVVDEQRHERAVHDAVVAVRLGARNQPELVVVLVDGDHLLVVLPGGTGLVGTRGLGLSLGHLGPRSRCRPIEDTTGWNLCRAGRRGQMTALLRFQCCSHYVHLTIS